MVKPSVGNGILLIGERRYCARAFHHVQPLTLLTPSKPIVLLIRMYATTKTQAMHLWIRLWYGLGLQDTTAERAELLAPQDSPFLQCPLTPQEVWVWDHVPTPRIRPTGSSILQMTALVAMSIELLSTPRQAWTSAAKRCQKDFSTSFPVAHAAKLVLLLS